ncbi:DUF2169 family type VI secretion system accessory protein [Roseibium sp. M-1]
MPDLYKPFRLSCIQNIQANGGQHTLYATVFYGFDLTDPEAILSEAVYTETATGQLPAGSFLDMGLPKAAPEVLIAGEARAPAGSMVKAQEIGVSLGRVTKRAMVFGDRHWVMDAGEIRMSDAVPYAAMPLTPDRAFGNETHPVNPAGRGCEPRYAIDHFGYAALPNIENADRLIKALTDKPEPVLFGPLGHEHPLRKSKTGLPGWDWIRTTFPEPPPGFDRAYYNMAPADQRFAEALQGNEPLNVWGMSAEHPVLRARLPGLRVRLFAVHDKQARRMTEIKTRIETVWIFGSSEIGGIYHRGAIRVADAKASDIVALIFGAERLSDEPRPAAYYSEIYRLRTHPTDGPMHTLNDSQLMPELPEAEREAIEARGQAYAEEIAQKFEKKIRFEHAEMLKASKLPEMMRPEKILPPVPRLPLAAPEDLLAGNVDIAGMLKKLAASANSFGNETAADAAAMISRHKAAGVPLPEGLLDFGKAMQAGLSEGNAGAARMLKDVAKGKSIAGDIPKYAKAAADISAKATAGETPPYEEAMPGGLDEALARIDAIVGKFSGEAGGGAGGEDLWPLVRARALALPEADPFYELKQTLEAFSRELKEAGKAPKKGEMLTVDDVLADPKFKVPTPTDFEKVLAELGTMPEKNKAKQVKLDAMLAEKLPKTAGHDLPPSLALAREVEKIPVPEPDIKSVDDIIAKAEAAIALEPASFFGDLDEEAREFLLDQEHPRSSMLEAVYPVETYTPEIRRQLGDLVVEHLARGESFARRDIADADLTGADLSNLDLNGVFLEQAILTGAKLRHARLSGAALTGAGLTDADATGADFTRTTLSGAVAERATMDETQHQNRTWQKSEFVTSRFRKATFDQMIFLECSFVGTDFEASDFLNCLFVNCDLTGARFRGAKFRKTMIIESDLTRSDWSGARFDRQLMTKVKARESRWSEASFKRSTFVGGSDLRGSYFDGMRGHYSSFLEADLDETCFKRAEVQDCLFLGCKMSGVDFRAARARKAVFNESVLVHSDFFAADLMEAHLSLCDARYASFRRTNLYSANLMDARVQCADFSQANLGQTLLELPSSNDT